MWVKLGPVTTRPGLRREGDGLGRTRQAMTMMRVSGFLMLLVALWPVQGIPAQSAGRFEDVSKLDLAYMDRQRSLLGDLAATELGRRFSGDREEDLDLLQTLLDRGLVRPDQPRELQAMGIILGDLLATEFDLHWVVYQDDVGRSRALRFEDTDFVVFPVTMISRRRQVGDKTPVADIYRKASDIIRTRTPTLTLQ